MQTFFPIQTFVGPFGWAFVDARGNALKHHTERLYTEKKGARHVSSLQNTTVYEGSEATSSDQVTSHGSESGFPTINLHAVSQLHCEAHVELLQLLKIQ